MIRRRLPLLVLFAAVLACGHDPSDPHPAHARHGHPTFEDAERWAAAFEDPARAEWQKPRLVLEALALRPDHVVADIGSATGYFPVRIAPEVPRGRVWGVDIEPSMVRYLNDRARRERLDNLFSILGTPQDPLLPEPVDRVLMVDTYHHIGDRTAWFANLADSLAPDARVVVVDFEMGDLPVGPPDAMKIPAEQVQREVEAAGYVLERTIRDALPYQYVLVFRRRDR